MSIHFFVEESAPENTPDEPLPQDDTIPEKIPDSDVKSNSEIPENDDSKSEEPVNSVDNVPVEAEVVQNESTTSQSTEAAESEAGKRIIIHFVKDCYKS